MNNDKKLEILKQIFGSPKFESGKQILFYCPSCNGTNKKLSINLELNVFKCWYCDFKGRSLFYLVKKYGNQNQISDWMMIDEHIDFASLSSLEEQSLEEDKIALPNEFLTLATHKMKPLMLKPIQYLKNRGLTYKDIVEWKIGFCIDGKYRERIIIPSFDLNGNINYFIARSYTDHPIRYLNPPLPKSSFIFNELLLDFSKPLCIVEGVFDAMVSGISSSIILNGSILNESSSIFDKIISKSKKIYLALDPDAGEKEKKMMKLLNMYGVECYKIDVRGYKDIAVMGKMEFGNRKNEAYCYSNDNDIELVLEE